MEERGIGGCSPGRIWVIVHVEEIQFECILGRLRARTCEALVMYVLRAVGTPSLWGLACDEKARTSLVPMSDASRFISFLAVPPPREFCIISSAGPEGQGRSR